MKSRKKIVAPRAAFDPEPAWMGTLAYRIVLGVACLVMMLGFAVNFDMMFGTRWSRLAPYYSASFKVALMVGLPMGAAVGAFHYSTLLVNEAIHRRRRSK